MGRHEFDKRPFVVRLVLTAMEERYAEGLQQGPRFDTAQWRLQTKE